jgi:hypothetical protein
VDKRDQKRRVNILPNYPALNHISFRVAVLLNIVLHFHLVGVPPPPPSPSMMYWKTCAPYRSHRVLGDDDNKMGTKTTSFLKNEPKCPIIYIANLIRLKSGLLTNWHGMEFLEQLVNSPAIVSVCVCC